MPNSQHLHEYWLANFRLVSFIHLFWKRIFDESSTQPRCPSYDSNNSVKALSGTQTTETNPPSPSILDPLLDYRGEKASLPFHWLSMSNANTITMSILYLYDIYS